MKIGDFYNSNRGRYQIIDIEENIQCFDLEMATKFTTIIITLRNIKTGAITRTTKPVFLKFFTKGKVMQTE